MRCSTIVSLCAPKTTGSCITGLTSAYYEHHSQVSFRYLILLVVNEASTVHYGFAAPEQDSRRNRRRHGTLRSGNSTDAKL